ncbi:tRNA preQ1(34) S-adenosylmethionine ribosyltransferase-isomerase QueA [Shimia ponticola]|uniref:tRNA preQ1(34) S-adenosylmethionine ribosyltransferase-isomerase QueA n=1 Tax=Shimia ponticola TaxID=2582893 RepID=UPI0011BDC050|nr:tRNA preQ1(34) S-adenosylmethionine ribosyltransferase-isomerase QueA [Shimia ponticola]
MKLSDFDFDLPERLIATRPARPRSSARLLVSHQNAIRDAVVRDLADHLYPGDRLIFNDTKVIPARLFGTRTRNSAQGVVEAKIEVTLLSPEADGCWMALVKPLRKWAEGEIVVFSDTLRATLIEKADGQARLRFDAEGDFDAALEQAGQMPLPPYIAAKRPADEQDKDDYQPIFAREQGAVAAPTASLHFDDGVMASLERRGVDHSFVTLHVGAGTFLPVKVDDIRDHKMHAEWGSVSEETADLIAETKARGDRVVPVGTTALRLLETAARGGQTRAWEGDTDIFITPGFEFHAADGLMTNFHLPKSTLMMLVAAFVGKDRTDAIYEHAIAQNYRFFSYGDASLLWPNLAS